jgi:DNA-binding MarR family transcriptional regulator
MNAKVTTRESAADKLGQLYARPGFMIRRAHQISIDIFIDACQSLDITPSQYGVMYVLRLSGLVSQIGIARLLGFDRSTTALVVKNLSERGLVTKEKSEVDARKTEIMLTPEGKKLLIQADKLADASKKALMAAFTKEEEKLFTALLSKFVSHFNDKTRVSISGDC